MVQNYMETMVQDILEKELKENAHKYVGLCQCPTCKALIQAVALNNLDPFYITTTAGEVYGEYRMKEQQKYSDVLVAIGLGIDALQKRSPHTASAV